MVGAVRGADALRESGGKGGGMGDAGAGKGFGDGGVPDGVQVCGGAVEADFDGVAADVEVFVV